MPRRGRPFAVHDDAWWNSRVRVDSATGCHIWTAGVCRLGYGRTRINGKTGVAHRFAYERAFGPFDPSLCVCHRCDNPSCVNPEHLFLGTHKDNMRDMFAKGRARPRGRAPGWRLALVLTEEPSLSRTSVPQQRGSGPSKECHFGSHNTSYVQLRNEPPRDQPWQRVIGVPSSLQNRDELSSASPRLRTSENPAERLGVAPLPRLRETE